MSPKSLLRHPRAVSTLEELANGSFQELIPEKLLGDPRKVETVALVSGKLYYELLEERETNKSERTALVRMEQIFPAPLSKLALHLRSFPNLKNLVWTQEEPKNMGSYQHIYFKLAEMLVADGFTNVKMHYNGRPERSSPATGSIYRHKVEQEKIIKDLFKI
jgi:2-oxoglutarate dehydrogenase E1 component